MPHVLIEVIGYVASALVVLSLSMTSVVRLRVVSLAGSLAYAVYGALIGAWPVMIANGIIVILNMWNLRKVLKPTADLDAVPMDVEAPFLSDFLKSHLGDIRQSQPEYESSSNDTAFVLMRDGMPAGVVVGQRAEDRLNITLDYVLPAFRDCRLGRWLYGDGSALLRGLGIREVTASPRTRAHQEYLVGVGFAATPSGALSKRLA